MYELGIDFGNSFISVSAFIDGHADILELCDKGSPIGGQYIMPVSVYMDANFKLILGNDAELKRCSDPLCYRNNFKKDLGSKVPYFIAGREIHPNYLCKEILKCVYEKAILKYGENLGKTVITYPAAFPIYKIELLKRAALLAGFKQIELVDDATAAAAYSCFENNYPKGSIFLIYDLGGTSFKLTLKLYSDDGFKNIIPPICIDSFGGCDFQRLIFNDIAAQNFRLYDRAMKKNDIKFMSLIEQLSESIKIRLDAEGEEELRIQLPVDMDLINYHISRGRYEELTAELVSTTVRLVNQVLKNSNLSGDEIKSLVFVGGTTKMPFVRKRVCSILNKPVISNDFPGMIVGMGAALIASGTDPIIKMTSVGGCRVKKHSYFKLGNYNGYQILWKIIDYDEGGYTAISENVLSFKAFDSLGQDTLFHRSSGEEEYGSSLWEYSTLRQWLNSSEKKVNYTHIPPDYEHVWFNSYDNESGFLYCFEELERRMLLGRTRTVLLPFPEDDTLGEKHIYNVSIEQALSNYDCSCCKQVVDRVAIPSVKIIVEEMSDMSIEYKAKPTKVAASTCEGTFGEAFDSDKYCTYWLDTSCANDPKSVRTVSYSGAIERQEACDGTVGIRPIIYLNKEIYIAAGEGTLESPYRLIQ